MIPIHNHTEYSALDGLATPREIAERCVEIGCPCCGISDHGTVAGHLAFAREMAKHDIKPIFGCELYHGLKNKKSEFERNERDQAHFIAGALTDEGLRNLWRLVDASAKNFRYVGRVNWELLEKHSKGLFATTACIQGLVAQEIVKDGDPYEPLNRYLEIFGDNFFIELHTYPGQEHEAVNIALTEIAVERGIPVIYATDAHMASKQQYRIHDSYVAMQTGQSIDTPIDERKMWHPPSLYIQDEFEVRDALSYLPGSVVDEAINSSLLIGEKATASLPEIKRHLPIFVPKECAFVPDEKREVSAAQLFVDLVETGIVERYGSGGDIPEGVWDRAAKEMEVFLEGGLEHYFLQTWDFCRWCDEEGIVRGPGRGSAGGAIVAYALGITDVDPIHYGLIFERFYNPGREKGFPDIDNDFPQRRRKDVRDYLKKRWGENRVRHIGTVIRMKPKAACDKTYSALGITWGEKEELKQIISQTPDMEILGPDSVGWSRKLDPGKQVYVADHVNPAIQNWVRDKPDRAVVRQRWIDFLEVICSRVQNYGVHASGIVVSDVDLPEELPAFWSSSQETEATMFPMDEVDKRMFVKQDLLGLRNLDTLDDWKQQMSEKGIEVEWSGLERQKHPEEMWKMLDDGLTLGIFQIERGYARRLCEEMKPRSVDDLAAIVSLNRPGPIRSGAVEAYMRRLAQVEEVTYGHPILEEILRPTYGLFLYQEQVIAYFSKLGYNLSDADAVRKILGKKKPEALQALLDGEGEWEGKGYLMVATGVLGNVGYAMQIWDKIAEFAKYSFNKPHAVEYATLAFRTLYAKYTATPEYIMACIRTNPDEAGLYVAEGRRMGITVAPPHITKSDVDVSVCEGDIYFGLSNVKGVGKAAAKYLVGLRDRYGCTTPDELQHAINMEHSDWEDTFKKGKSPRQRLRSNQIEALINAGAFDEYESRSLTLVKRQELEKELLGVILSDECDQAFENNFELLQDCDDYESEEEFVTLPGVITQLKATKTKAAGKDMGIVTIEHSGSEAEFVVFPQQWKAYKFLWRERTPGIFTLKKTERGIHFQEGQKLN